MEDAVLNLSDFNVTRFEGVDMRNMNISKLLPFPSDLIYKDRFGVYYVNQKIFEGESRDTIAKIGKIQVPLYVFNMDNHTQASSNTPLSQCRQLMKENGNSSGSVALSSRFLYGIPPIAVVAKSWDRFVAGARISAKKARREKREAYKYGQLLHTPIGTYVENIRYNVQRQTIDVLIPNAQPMTRYSYREL